MSDSTGFEIVITPASLTRSSRGQVAGQVHVVIGGLAFPEPDWSDSIALVLLAWAEAMAELLGDPVHSVEVRFLDGPYLVHLSPQEPSRWQIAAVVTAPRERVVASVEASTDQIRQAVSEALQRFLAESSQRSWWTPEIDRLAMLHERLLPRAG